MNTAAVLSLIPVICLVSMPGTGAAAGRTPGLYELPYPAEELAPGEQIFRGKKIHSDSGPQKWGYDLDAVRQLPVSGVWSRVKHAIDWRNPQNPDFVVYGKRVYAMAPGKVIRCWRNAPENPRPYSAALGDDLDQDFENRKWLHQALRDRLMPEDGNHLLLRQSGRRVVLYAHAQPGSIPASLCPHDGALFSRPDRISQTDVAAVGQASVKTGQYLFRTGNSGNSTAPHLHVHAQTPGGRPLIMLFRSGLFIKMRDSKTEGESWRRLDGKRIPDGPVLIRPPRRSPAGTRLRP